jgi:hypothetical protein
MIRDTASIVTAPARAWSAARARWVRFVLALVLLATIAGCYTYVDLPGEVSHEELSPAYVLQIVNRTGNRFAIEPSAYGGEKGFPVQPVADGASFEVPMQVRRFRIGERDGVGGRQMLDGPYIAQEGASSAVIRVRHSELYLLTIDLENDNWFNGRRDAAPMPLKLELENFEPKRWFRSGPP